METSDATVTAKKGSPSSSPEASEAGFVMVPPSLAGDSSKVRAQGLGVSPLTARYHSLLAYLAITWTYSDLAQEDRGQARQPSWGVEGSLHRAHPGEHTS